MTLVPVERNTQTATQLSINIAVIQNSDEFFVTLLLRLRHHLMILFQVEQWYNIIYCHYTNL